MKRTRLAVFVLLVVAQVLVVGNMVRSSEVVLREGTKVVLATAPVDPRDLFRGDYVVLRYQIETISLGEIETYGVVPQVGNTVWVRLERHGEFDVPVVLGSTPAPAGAVAIRGTITHIHGDQAVLDYDINEYFIPESTGREIEWAGRVDVVVAIDADGRAVIDHLIVDGQRWEARS